MELIAVILLVLLVLFGEIGLYRRNGLKGLSYRCRFSETECTEGDSLQFVETVSNEKGMPVPWLKAELTTSCWLDFPGTNSSQTGENRFVTSFFSVRGHAKVSRVWNITCEKRGAYEMEHVVLVTSDLLGVVRLSLQAEDTGGTLLVLPQRMTEAGLILPRLLHQQFGDQSVRHSLAFPQVSGNTCRVIHSTGCTGKPRRTPERCSCAGKSIPHSKRSRYCWRWNPTARTAAL